MRAALLPVALVAAAACVAGAIIAVVRVKPSEPRPRAVVPLPDQVPAARAAAPPVWAPRLETAIGDVSVSVRRATVGPTEIIQFGFKGRGEGEHLQLRIGVRNVSRTKKVEYVGWGYNSQSEFESRGRAVLTDEFGNNYRIQKWQIGIEVVDQVRFTSIAPGEAAADVLVFEKPIPQAKRLSLRLPAVSVGEQGEFRLEIPWPMDDAPK